MDDDLGKKLDQWLRGEGYPFEMRVAQTFSRAGFNVTQSDYYTDPETHKPREIDLVATTAGKSANKVIFRIVFPIECKTTKDKPWVLFCPPDMRMAPPFRVAQRITNDLGTVVSQHLASDENVQKLNIFGFRDSAGYSLMQGFKNTGGAQDHAYLAICSVANAASAMAIRWKDHPNKNRIVEFIFPVIVIDRRLFRCGLQPISEDIAVTEIQSGTLLWRNAPSPYSAIIIDIQTASSIEEFARQAFQDAHKLVTEYIDDVYKLLKLNRLK